MPVIDETGPFGLIQVSSAMANAFSQKDVEALRQSARSIVWARRQVMQRATQNAASVSDAGTTRGPGTWDGMCTNSSQSSSELEEDSREASGESTTEPSVAVYSPSGLDAGRQAIIDASDDSQISVAGNPGSAERSNKGTSATSFYSLRGADEQKPSARYENVITAVLGMLVVGAALLLGTLIGVRFGWQKAVHLPTTKQSDADTVKSSAAKTGASASNITDQPSNAVPAETEKPGSHDSAKSTGAPTDASSSAARTDERTGNLVVYENNKVVFRQSGTKADVSRPPARSVSSSPVVAIPADEASSRLIYRRDPQASPAAKLGIPGPVRLQATIDADGSVSSVGVLEGDPALAAAAIKAVRQWRYRPYLVNGTPTAVQTTITINFPGSAQ